MPGEEAESLSDPGSRFVWRSAVASARDASVRAVLTTIKNPRPDQEVREVEIVSRRALASYLLLAASVVSDDVGTALPEAVPPPDGARAFTKEMRIRIVDAKTGEPVAGALVEPSATIGGTNAITPPLFTDARGVARVSYDPARTKALSLRVAHGGHEDQDFSWTEAVTIPDEFTLTLSASRSAGPVEVALAQATISDLIGLQGRQLAALAALEEVSREDAAELLETCAELARRGACPGFVVPREGGAGVDFFREETAGPGKDRGYFEDKLATRLCQVGAIHLSGEAGTPREWAAMRRVYELARRLAPGSDEIEGFATKRPSN
jgi:hypothetical protein